MSDHSVSPHHRASVAPENNNSVSEKFMAPGRGGEFIDLAHEYMRAHRAVTMILTGICGAWFVGFITLMAPMREIAAVPVGPLSVGWLYALSAFPVMIGLNWLFGRVSSNLLDPMKFRAVAAANLLTKEAQ